MKKITADEIKEYFNQFKQGYDVVDKAEIWASLSNNFKRFWNDRVMKSGKQIEDIEVDPIIRILDRNGKGNHGSNSEAVAKAMIAQGAWRRMFNELHNNTELHTALNQVFIADTDDARSTALNKVYKLNKDHKNSLTGPSGNAINTMLAAYDPISNLSMISVGDRIKFLKSIDVLIPEDFEDLSQGHKIVLSQNLVIEYFRKLGSNDTARTISEFIYTPSFKTLWRESEQPEINDDEDIQEDIVVNKNTHTDYSEFYAEKQLEDFIIENWETTEFGEKFDLIQEGDKFSQQYPTKIGEIDILAKEKKSNKYVVIELKKGKTSDDVVGQIARYVSWISVNKSKDVRGIIVTSEPDEKLHYAVKQIKNVELWIYKLKVDFKLIKIENSDD